MTYLCGVEMHAKTICPYSRKWGCLQPAPSPRIFDEKGGSTITTNTVDVRDVMIRVTVMDYHERFPKST